MTTAPALTRSQAANRSWDYLVGSTSRTRDQAVTAAVAQIRSQVSGLRSGPADKIRQGVDAVIDEVIVHLAGDGSSWEASRRAGRRNATARVPIEDMLCAFNLCAAELWSKCTADDLIGRTSHDIAADARRFWDVFERATSEAVTAYRMVEQDRATVERSRRERIVKRILHGSGHAGMRWDELGNLCGLPRVSRAVVAVAEHGGPAPFLLKDHLRRRGVFSVWFEDTAGSVGVIRVGPGGVDEVVRALSKLDTAVIAVGPVANRPGELPRSFELAELLFGARSTPCGVVTFAQDPLGPLVAAAPVAASVLVRETLGGVLGLPAAERDSLLATLEAFVEMSGSTSSAAARLFCHRNTVLNRLRRIEDVTHLSVSRADDLARLWLALRALRLEES
jgi:hypothetical protein